MLGPSKTEEETEVSHTWWGRHHQLERARESERERERETERDRERQRKRALGGRGEGTGAEQYSPAVCSVSRRALQV